jgi:hypothetical protein
MKKLLGTLFCISCSCAVGINTLSQNTHGNNKGTFSTNPGDVNFGLDLSPNNQAYKFRLLVGVNQLPTVATGCIAPNTGYPQSLTKYAVVQDNVLVTVQASPCGISSDNWQSLNTNFQYQSIYYYNVACDLVSQTCHM